MKKRILSLLLTLVMILGMIPATTMTAFAESGEEAESGKAIVGIEGLGTPDNPYLITHRAQWTILFGNYDASQSGSGFDGQYVKLCTDIAIDDMEFQAQIFEDTHLDLNVHTSELIIARGEGCVVEVTGSGAAPFRSMLGATLILNDTVDFDSIRLMQGTLILNSPSAEGEVIILDGNSTLILKQGTVTNLSIASSSSARNTDVFMYGGRLEDEFFRDTSYAEAARINFAFYGGVIAPDEVSQDKDMYYDVEEVEYIVENTSYAFFTDGTTKKIASYDDLVDAIVSYGEFDVYAPYFAEQYPEMPAGQTTHNLGKVSASEYVMTFASQDIPSSLSASGCKVIEQLVVYDRDNNGEIVDIVTNNPAINGTGISYPLKNLPSGNYTIRESIILYDKDGKALLGTNNDFILEVETIVNNINVSATFSGTPAKATTSTTGAEVTETKWYKQNGSSWTELGASDTIKEGNTYRCEVTVGTTGTYTLADGYTVKINGTAATKKSGNTWYRDVTITGYTSYVDVDDIDLPEAYTNPDFTYNDEEGAAYHWDVVQVEWFECDKDGKVLSDALTENDVFQKDTYYRVEVTVVPETNWQFHGSALGFYINGKAANYLYGYNKAYPDSVTGYLVYNTADIERDYELFVYDDSLSGSAKNIYIKDGQYLGSNATGATAIKPASGGYAYYKDGVLELNGYDNEKAHFIFEELALELYLVGDNTIGAIYDNEFGMAGGNLEVRQGKLVIDAADGGKLTIASNPLDAYANIQVKDLYFNGGELTSCLANETYGAAVQLNGGNLYLEDGYVAYVSDTNDFASATKWDGTTGISGYDCVWIVEEQATVTHTVTFKVDTTTVATKTVEDGKTVTAPADPTQSGKTFLGWYTDGGTKFDFTTPITGDITLTAKFEDVTSNITVNCIGDIDYTVSGNVVTVDHEVACKVGYLDGTAYKAITATANGDGTYSFTAPAGVTEVLLVVKGDVSGDTNVNVADKMAVERSLLLTSHPAYQALTEIQKFAANMDSTEVINMADKMTIERSLLLTSHPAYQALTW